jgi:hypothetical protein
MEVINQIVGFTEAMVERFPTQVTPIDPAAFAVILGVLIVLCAGSVRFVTVFGTAVLILLGFFMVAAPSNALILFAIGSGLAAIVQFRRRLAVMQKQLDRLSLADRELEQLLDRRLRQSR